MEKRSINRSRTSSGTEHGLGEWVRDTRKDLGISQRALADSAGLSRSYLCDIERGRGTQPSVTTLDKLADALGASRSDLLRAAGVIEQESGPRHSDTERRLLSVLRDLSEAGQRDVVRYARFVHTDEHQVVQSVLIAHEDPSLAVRHGDSRHPTLFDLGDD
ncbi:MAG: helix-turn-helix transcriptional regulator [Thermomicrobiales bacterium]